MGFFDDLSKKVQETTSSFQEATNKIEKENISDRTRFRCRENVLGSLRFHLIPRGQVRGR